VQEVGVWRRSGYNSMGPLCGLRLGQNTSLTLNNRYIFFTFFPNFVFIFRQGRLVFIPLTLIVVTFGLIKTLSVNYAMFLVFEVLEASITPAIYTTPYILGKLFKLSSS